MFHSAPAWNRKELEKHNLRRHSQVAHDIFSPEKMSPNLEAPATRNVTKRSWVRHEKPSKTKLSRSEPAAAAAAVFEKTALLPEISSTGPQGSHSAPETVKKRPKTAQKTYRTRESSAQPGALARIETKSAGSGDLSRQHTPQRRNALPAPRA